MHILYQIDKSRFSAGEYLVNMILNLIDALDSAHIIIVFELCVYQRCLTSVKLCVFCVCVCVCVCVGKFFSDNIIVCNQCSLYVVLVLCCIQHLSSYCTVEKKLSFTMSAVVSPVRFLSFILTSDVIFLLYSLVTSAH